jgi:hypothetical protein
MVALVALLALLALIVVLEATTHERYLQVTPRETSIAAYKPTSFMGPMRKCTLSMYNSFPPPGSPEWSDYDGQKYLGCFHGLPKCKTQSWVKNHNIAAVHSKDFAAYKNKWLLVVDVATARALMVKVIDSCSDADTPNNDCTRNRKWGGNGFLVDIEYHTAQRLLGKRLDVHGGDFGLRNGICALVYNEPKNPATARYDPLFGDDRFGRPDVRY